LFLASFIIVNERIFFSFFLDFEQAQCNLSFNRYATLQSMNKGERKSLVDGCPLRFCSSVLMDQQETVLRKFFAPGPKVNMDSPTDK